MVSTSVCGSGQCGFKSRRSPQFIEQFGDEIFVGHLAWCKKCNFLTKVDDCNGHPHCDHCDRVDKKCKECGHVQRGQHDHLDYDKVSFGGDWEDDERYNNSRDKALNWLSKYFKWDIALTKQKIQEHIGYDPWSEE